MGAHKGETKTKKEQKPGGQRMNPTDLCLIFRSWGPVMWAPQDPGSSAPAALLFVSHMDSPWGWTYSISLLSTEVHIHGLSNFLEFHSTEAWHPPSQLDNHLLHRHVQGSWPCNRSCGLTSQTQASLFKWQPLDPVALSTVYVCKTSQCHLPAWAATSTLEE